jgi:hypothetical protein
VGCAPVALWLGEDASPKGRPARCRGPRHNGWAHARRTLAAPGHPGLRAAACGPRRAPGLLWQGGGGGRAVAWGAEGDEPPRGEDRARSWEGLAQGDSGRARRARRAGGGAIGASLPGDPELGDEGLPQAGLGREDACIGGVGGGRCEGLETRGDASGRAPVVRTEEGCAGGTVGAWHRREGRPATQAVAEDRGVFRLPPVQPGRARGLEGPGEAVGAPPCGADHAATGLDELGEGAPRGALRGARRQRVAMGAQQGALAGGGRGGVWGPAGRAGVARPRQGQGREREEAPQVIRASGGAQGAWGACETEGHGVAGAPRAPCGAPRGDGLRGGLELKVLPVGGASRLEAPLRLGLRPVEPHKGRQGGVGRLGHASSPRVWERGEKGQAR